MVFNYADDNVFRANKFLTRDRIKNDSSHYGGCACKEPLFPPFAFPSSFLFTFQRASNSKSRAEKLGEKGMNIFENAIRGMEWISGMNF